MINPKVLLVNPPFPARFNGAPMNLLGLATSLHRNGTEVQILDLCLSDQPEQELLAAISASRPMLLGFGSYSPSHLAVIGLAERVKESYPDLPIVKGGIHETFVPNITLARHRAIDYTIQGNGEVPLSGLIEHLLGRRSPASVEGLSYRLPDGRAGLGQRSPSMVLIRDNDPSRLPIPERRLLSTSAYYNFPVFAGKKTAQVMSARGCPFHCSFCPASSYGESKRRYRAQPIERVAAEIEYLKGLGFTALFFDDAVFSIGRSRTEELCQVLSEYGMEWGCQTRVDLVDEPLLRRMAASGCTYVYFGVEAGDDHQLEQMRKGIRSDQTWRSIALAAGCDIRVAVSLIVGYPSETDQQLVETFRRLTKCDRTRVSLSAFALYPGTEEWDRRAEIGLVRPESYEQPHSTEEVWRHFDEGVGSIHCIPPERAERILDIAKDILGDQMNVDLPCQS